MHENGVVEDISLTSMMVEDVERTPLRPEKKRRKDLYYTEKERFRLSVRKKNVNKEGKKNLLSMIEETVKTMKFDTITTMAMEANKGGKNKEHANDCISESEMKMSSKNTRNKKVSHLNFHII